ncbi:MAG: DNA alkylation repair protein [archaeon]
MASLKQEIAALANARCAAAMQRYFKTGKGEYGEGDKFLGLTIGQQREIAKSHKGIALQQLAPLMQSGIHEERLVALLILVEKFSKAGEEEKRKIFDFYFENMAGVNNWDLVDLTAPKIVGAFLLDKDRKMLYRLAKSQIIWEKRIAIMATLAFIKEKDFKDTFAIAELFLNDKHDLIHKAVGWMIRETGNRDLAAEEAFLKKHYGKMPRTMLRYAIEKFPEEKRLAYLKGTI